MAPETASQILDLLAEAKRKAKDPEARVRLDTMAVGIISQDIRPQVMAANLKYWFDLGKHLRPAA